VFIQINFVYFGQTVNQVQPSLEGDFNLTCLSGCTIYHIQPFHQAKSNGLYFYRPIFASTNQNVLDDLNADVRATFPATYSQFTATSAYMFTWVLKCENETTHQNKSVIYQVILSTDMTSSFMFIIFITIETNSDEATYYVDGKNQTNFFSASIVDSNCGKNEEYIFQLNTGLIF
jgi:hypothetical protein